jgi:DivIVA domain-containing protein
MFERMELVKTFPHTSKTSSGYDIEAVDTFLAEARAAYEADSPTARVTSKVVREASFPMQRGGYVIEQVDNALERLEIAMAEREREHAIETEGWEPYTKRLLESSTEVLLRLSRPARKRFRRAGVLVVGYKVSDVDAFATRIVAYLESGSPLTADEVRKTVFRSQRGGYDERQVDMVLDAVVEAILASGRH